MMTRRSAVLHVMAIVLCTASLGMRIWKQGPYVPGWAFVGAAQAEAMVHAHSLSTVATSLHDWSKPWDVFGLMTLAPAWLALQIPWAYWFVAVSLLGSAAAVVLVAAAVRAPVSIALMAWTASGTLQSWSLLGYTTNSWAHAVALWLILRVRRWWVTLLFAPVVVLLGWGLQDLGRTVGIVFLAATLFIPQPPAARTVNAALGVVLTWAAYRIRTEGPLFWFTVLAERPWQLGTVEQVDSAAFLALMVLSTLLLWRRPFFWLTAFGQLALFAVLLLIDEGNARRFTLCSFYGVFLAASAWHAAPRARNLLTTVALFAALAQVTATAVWARRPLGGEWEYILPFTAGQPWAMVPFAAVNAYLAIRADLDAGRAVVLLYNGDAYLENCTNPTGLLARLYLGLGPERFERDVIAFGESSGCINHSLPMHPIDAAPAVLAQLAGRPFVAYVFHHPADPPSFAPTLASVREELEARYALAWDQPVGGPSEGTFQRALATTPLH